MDELLLGLAVGLASGLGLGVGLSRLQRHRQGRHKHGLRRRVEGLQQQAREQERLRLLREIHDGVGAQLTGMLQLVERPSWPRALLAEQVQLAVDELRLAVDSLQPEADELGALLAQLRHRLRPRLQAAGLQVDWEPPDLPLLRLSAGDALDLQRLLLEAFTNVLKHAHAARVRLELGLADGLLILRLCDDGVGLGVRSASPNPGRGLGLASMQARALRLGAELELLPVQPQGLCVCLRLPLARRIASAQAPPGAR